MEVNKLDMQDFKDRLEGKSFKTVLADPPWSFDNKATKAAPEHTRLFRYNTVPTKEIAMLPVGSVTETNAHLYLWVPSSLLQDGLFVLKEWGFKFKTILIWEKVTKAGLPDGRGMGYYFRNSAEIILFGVKGSLRTLAPGRTQVNVIRTQKREHSRKPDEFYNLIESCSEPFYLELFARGNIRDRWAAWGNQAGV